MDHHQFQTADLMPKFHFERLDGDVYSGRFHLDEEFLRSAFLHIDSTDFYGMRHLDVGDRSTEVGLLDPRRREFVETCRRYGEGQIELAGFGELVDSGCGMVVNSLQNSESRAPNLFNEMARLFLRNLGHPPNRCAEELDIVLYLGTYDRGFGLHLDAADTVAFVLDGSKNFEVRTVSETGEPRNHTYTLQKGQYLRWRSIHWHTNANPTLTWTISLHFTLGPAALRMVKPGTPVDYDHSATLCKDHMAFIARSRSAARARQP